MPRLEGAGITREQFLLREMRIVCRLRLDGRSDGEVVALVEADNLFQYPTERTTAKIARACVKRMNAVDSDAIVSLIADGDLWAAAQANLYAMMCTYPLVRHFMLNEIARHFLELDYSLGAAEMGAYMTRLQMEYDNMAAATDSTIEKIKQVLHRCLIECGMLANVRSDELIPLLMEPEVREAIEAKGDVDALPAFNCLGVF